MLSRTADHLFWMARYMERAENTARMLDVNYQTVAAAAVRRRRPSTAGAACSASASCTGDYAKRYGDVDAAQRDGLHGERRGRTRRRIVSCLRAARENARAVRGTLTTEVWETQNQTWLEFTAHGRERRASSATRASSSNGSSSARTCRAASRSAPCCRTRPSTSCASARFLERADNTARLLDVKFHARRQRLLRHAPTSATDRVRLLSLVGDPALGLRLRGLSQGLPQRDPAREGGRAADPARRHAALAGRLHARGGVATCSGSPTSSRRETLRRAGRLRGRPAATAASTRSWRPGCTPT